MRVGRSAVVQAGLAGVGRTVFQHLGAAAAVGRRQSEDGLFRVAVLAEARLRFQAAAAVPEAVGGALGPAGVDGDGGGGSVRKTVSELVEVRVKWWR